jgi:glycerol-1-phosphatase
MIYISGLVFEDAPSGITSGKAAGAKVLAVLTSHSRESVEATNPDYLVEDLSR